MKNLDAEPEIRDPGLAFIWHTVWTFARRLNFVIWKYLLQTCIDIYVTLLYKKSAFYKMQALIRRI